MANDRSGNDQNIPTRGDISQIGRRMSDPILDSLKQYWEKLRAGRLAPYRSEIDPRQFEHALENMFILELVDDNVVRVRLAGMRLCELMGMEVRGMSPETFVMQEDRARFGTLVQQVAQTPAVVEIALETVDFRGRSGTAYMLLMPLRNDFGEITRILGCISDHGEDFDAPVRFRITQVTTDEIPSGKAGVTPPHPGFSEPRTRYEAAPQRGPQLRAIEGGVAPRSKLKADDSAPRDRSHLHLVVSRD